jgi:putative heme iron utilization protein
MNASNRSLGELVRGRRVAALGTLHEGEPSVSMVPYALLPEGAGFLVHVSGMAAHTADMLAHPRVSLLIVAPDDPATAAQALPRVTVLGRAVPLDRDTPAYAEGRELYLARFPQSATTFGLADFRLFAIRPLGARSVAGFARAETLSPEQLASALA